MIFQKPNEPGKVSWGSVFALIAMIASPLAAALPGTAGLVATCIGTAAGAVAAKLP